MTRLEASAWPLACGIAWLRVTGFDVHRYGDIRITGSEDAVRLTVPVLAGSSRPRYTPWPRRAARPHPVWGDFHESAIDQLSGDMGLDDRISPRSVPVRIERPIPRTPHRGTE